MPDSIPVSTVCKPAATANSIAATFEQMIREQIPNLFRLNLNPYVTQACYCLTQYVAESVPGSSAADKSQVFLANSGEEALSGAVKLARYVANVEGRPSLGVLIDEENRFEHFAGTELAGTELAGWGCLEFIPGLKVFRDSFAAASFLAEEPSRTGFLVVPHSLLGSTDGPLLDWISADGEVGQRPLVIAYTDRKQLADCAEFVKTQSTSTRTQLRPDNGQSPLEPPYACSIDWGPDNKAAPDIVLFNESFVNHEVPFGAFVAGQRLFQHWNQRGMSTFHSTTYQPNTVSTLHFLNCLCRDDPEFVERHQQQLNRIEHDPEFRYQTFANLISRPLAKLTKRVGFAGVKVQAAGHYVTVPGMKPIFDGVAGVACSIRGHNPPTYVEELDNGESIESCRDELSERLHSLTGLPQMTPAVSGASAVEQALKLSLAASFPRDYVLALRGGFGGKTLFALTGTWKPALRAGLAPLYSNVVFVDPFAEDAVDAIRLAFADYPIGVAQLELIQGVGGVRAIPNDVLECLSEQRACHECLLFVDEVQTGMFRTGPFARSTDVGIQPDLMTVGKSTSDMMFPFAMTLYSDAVRNALEERDCSIPEVATAGYGYETGFRTVLNTLRRVEQEQLTDQVRRRSEQFALRLGQQLQDCRLVKDVRCFGLLIGIELDAERGLQRWMKKLVYQLYLLAMLQHPTFPLLMGFCQYEHNVLKFTPPLTITDDEVQQACQTISDVLRRSLSSVAMSGAVQTAFGLR